MALTRNSTLLRVIFIASFTLVSTSASLVPPTLHSNLLPGNNIPNLYGSKVNPMAQTRALANFSWETVRRDFVSWVQ